MKYVLNIIVANRWLSAHKSLNMTDVTFELIWGVIASSDLANAENTVGRALRFCENT